MEDGDVIDALLQQACAHFISHSLCSSSRLFRSEVAYTLLMTFPYSIWESHISHHRHCDFFLVLYLSFPYLLPKTTSCSILSLRQQVRLEGRMLT